MSKRNREGLSKAGFPDPQTLPCRAVLIDLDNTLYAYGPAHEAALKECYRRLPGAPDFASYAAQYKQARTRVTNRLYPSGACRSRLLAFQALCEGWRIPRPYEKALELDNAYWNQFIEAMSLDREAEAFLGLCKSRNLPLCIVSDMTAEIQIRKIIKLGLKETITHLVTSEETGREKPDPAMFNAALSKLGHEARECIMLGDDVQKDIEGAEKLGIPAYLIRLASEGPCSKN